MTDAQNAEYESEVSQADLTRGERALAKEVHATDFENLDDTTQERFIRLLDDMPDRLRAGLDGNLVTKQQLDEGMEDVFKTMVEDEDVPEEWKDGAAVFAKGLKKKFGLGEVET